MLKNLRRCNSFAVRFQSALVRRVAENRCKHFPCCGHAIPADGMSVELKSQLDVAVAKQSLHGFRISSGADEKRREAVAKIVKSKAPWIIINQLSRGIPVRGKNAGIHLTRYEERR
jgi:hypothetical protein